MKKIFKKISVKTAILVLMIMFVGSCSKSFLEPDPQQSVNTKDALVTLGDFEAAITGIYDGLGSSNYYGRYFVLVTDIMSDDVKQNASANRASDWADYTGSSTDNNSLAENIWQQGYIVIRRCNQIILSEPDIPAADMDVYNDIVGQAYAARALAHFDLVRIYGQHFTFTAGGSHLGVPIVLDMDTYAKPSRASVADVYTQIITDFNTAITIMDVDNDDPYYLNSWGVKALLSRVYLYMEDYTNAVLLATDVIDNGPATLVPNADYADIFGTESSDESLFEISKTETDNSGTDALAGMYLGSGYGDYLPSQDLITLIPVGDVRETMYYDDPDVGGGIYGTTRVNKYSNNLGWDNTKVIRLSEVYLNRAEANYYIAGAAAETLAQDDATAIRQRGLPTALAVSTTGQALLDDILLERRLELCYEGHRLWDLTRNMLDMDRTDCTSQTCLVTYPNDRFVLAIGQYEIDVNTNVAQNPGY